eukprot:XP_014784167.1 PREDICTED: uncharacterized protein LOC106879209 isoform X1 [Octopus bimaculoides]
MAIETRQHACSIATGDGESDVLEQPSARTSLTSHLRKAPAGEERSLKQNANSQPVLFTSYTEGEVCCSQYMPSQAVCVRFIFANAGPLPLVIQHADRTSLVTQPAKCVQQVLAVKKR